MADRTDMSATEREILEHLRVLRETLQPEDGTAEDTALCSLETFVNVALRVMKRANPSVVRDCARTVEIKARLDGIPVLRGAA